MSQPGNVRYVLVLDDTNFTTKAKAVQTNLRQMDIATQSSSRGFGVMSTSMNTLGTASQKAGTNMGTLNTNLKGTQVGLTSTNTLSKQASAQTASLGTQIKNTTTKFAGFATGLSATTTGVLQLSAGFRDYGDSQIAVDKQTRKLTLAQEAVDKTTRKVNEAIAKGGKGSRLYTDAIRDQQQAQANLAIQTELLGERQEDMFDAQTQFVSSVIPTVLGAVGTLGMAYKDLGLKGSSITGMFSKFGGALTLMKLLRLDIPVSNEFLEVLTELCKIRQWDLKRYVTQTLHNGIELDLTSPQEIGIDVCKNLKEMIHPTGT